MKQKAIIREQIQHLQHRVNELETEKAAVCHLLHQAMSVNQIKSDLLARASHDLRSPLTNIQLSASLIERYYKRLDQDKIFGHLAKIKDEINRFVIVLNTFLLDETK